MPRKLLGNKENPTKQSLEGFLSELPFEDIKILEILESESNQDKFSDNPKAKGLLKASKELDYLKMDKKERAIYDRHQKDRHHNASLYESTYVIGEIMGIKKVAINSLKKGLDIEIIADITGLSIEEVESLKEDNYK